MDTKAKYLNFELKVKQIENEWMRNLSVDLDHHFQIQSEQCSMSINDFSILRVE